MAVMTVEQRLAVRREITRLLSEAREPINLTKAEILAAVNAADQWVSDNAASYNVALPQPARNTLTPAQKARLLMHVVRQRFVTGV